MSEQAKMHPSLHNFDNLPDSANVRLPVLKGLCDCSASTVWRLVRAGKLPKPRKLSERVTAWNVGELRQTLKAITAGAK